MDLMATEPYDGIKVIDICSEAGVGRATFYRSFDSKDSVLEAFFYDIMDDISDNAEQSNDGTWSSYKNYMESVFETLSGHREQILAIHRNGLLHRFKGPMMRSFRYDDEADGEKRFAIAYHVGGIIGFLGIWADGGMIEEPAHMAELAVKIVGSPRRPALMGHSSTRTTERFYGRQKNLMAIEKARKTWGSDPEETSSETPTGHDGKGGYDTERTMDHL